MKILRKEENEKVYKSIKMAIIGTHLNYPQNNISEQLQYAYSIYFKALEEEPEISVKKFCNCFSEESKIYGIKLRNPLYAHYTSDSDNNIPLMTLDMLKDFCKERINNPKTKPQEKIPLMEYVLEYYETIKRTDIEFNEIDQYVLHISEFRKQLQGLVEKLNPVVDILCDNTNIKELFYSNDINIKDITRSGYAYLKNIGNDNKTFASYGGELLNGAISLESDIGRGKYKTQQDTVLSVVKDKDFFLNAVADGVGGEGKGENASVIAVNELKSWFDKLEKEDLISAGVENVEFLVQYEIEKIHNKISEENAKRQRQKRTYGDYVDGRNDNDYTTIVLALTVGDNTIIANIGDSTAYEYDKKRDELHELTISDSPTGELSYEDRRNAQGNSVITDALGHPQKTGNPHITTIPNDGRRIILSSDGVTDLINEKHFKQYFKNRDNAKRIVMDAKNNPDMNKNHKMDDNISAIVVDLPNKAKENASGRGY